MQKLNNEEGGQSKNVKKKKTKSLKQKLIQGTSNIKIIFIKALLFIHGKMV